MRMLTQFTTSPFRRRSVQPGLPPRVGSPLACEDGETDDMSLLRQYASTGCQDSFGQIVTRHIDWVYSTCLREVHDEALAEDATQAVFIILSRKAANIREGTRLSGWLFKAARFASADARKRERRHKRLAERATEAALAAGPAVALAEHDEAWHCLSPALDRAVSCLSSKDREAVLLRFYEGKSLREVGDAMGISEEAAKKRVNRAVEKLRSFLREKGIVIPALLLLVLMDTSLVQAAPAALAKAAAQPAAASAAARAIAENAIREMLGATTRLLSAIAGGAIAAAAVAWGLAQAVSPAPQAKDVVIISDPVGPVVPGVDYSTRSAEHMQIRAGSVVGLWITAGETVLWHYEVPGATTKAQAPVVYPSDISFTDARPRAVAVDRNGRVWVRPLSENLMDDAAPALRRPIAPALPDPVDRRLAQQILGGFGGFAGGSAGSGGATGPANLPANLVEDSGDSYVPETQNAQDWLPFNTQMAPYDPIDGMMRIQNFFAQDTDTPGKLRGDFDYPGLDTVAVPEPSIGGLLLAGAALMGLRRRRRRA